MRMIVVIAALASALTIGSAYAANTTVPTGSSQGADDTVPNDSSSASESAKMGKDPGTQSGDQGAQGESDTQKIDQPPRQNPTTGQ
jgi:hypothetical protein